MTIQPALRATLLGCAALISPVQQPVPSGQRFPLPDGPLSITAPNNSTAGESLADVLRRFSALAHQNITASQSTMSELEGTRVGLMRPVEVPAGELYSFVESLLLQNSFFLTELRDEEPRLLAVYSRNDRHARGIREQARSVPEEALSDYEDHPALLVRTVIDISPAPAGLVAHSMQFLAQDQSAYAVRSSGETSLTIEGPGAWVAETAKMARRVARHHAAFEERKESAAAGEGGGDD